MKLNTVANLASLYARGLEDFRIQLPGSLSASSAARKGLWEARTQELGYLNTSKVKRDPARVT